MEVDRLHEIDDVEVEHADAVHASVDAEVVLGDHPVQVGGLAERKRELGRGDRGHDVEREQKRDGAHRRLREDENGRVDARLAQLDALFDRGDRQMVRTRRERRARDLDGAVPVAVGLHDRQQVAARPQVAMRHLDVVRDGAEVDLDPGIAREGVDRVRTGNAVCEHLGDGHVLLRPLGFGFRVDSLDRVAKMRVSAKVIYLVCAHKTSRSQC